LEGNVEDQINVDIGESPESALDRAQVVRGRRRATQVSKHGLVERLDTQAHEVDPNLGECLEAVGGSMEGVDLDRTLAGDWNERD
jgi:hypothetical protein